MKQVQQLKTEKIYVDAIFKRIQSAIEQEDHKDLYKTLVEGSAKLDQDMVVSMLLKSVNDALDQNRSNIVELIMANITSFYAQRFQYKVDHAANQNGSECSIAQNDNAYDDLRDEYCQSARNIKSAIAEQVFGKLLNQAKNDKVVYSNKMVQAVVKHVERPSFIQYHLKDLSTNEAQEVENIFDLLGLKMGAIFAVSNPDITRIH